MTFLKSNIGKTAQYNAMDGVNRDDSAFLSLFLSLSVLSMAGQYAANNSDRCRSTLDTGRHCKACIAPGGPARY